MNVELKDLAPLLLKKERAGGDIDAALLADILHNGKQRNDRRKEMVALVERHPVLSDRNMQFRNHTERYNMGLKKAYHYVQLLREKQITDKQDQQEIYLALGEPLTIDVHRSMFIPTLENQADDEQQRKWLPLARNFKIFGAYAQTELGHGSNVQGIETTATYDKQTQEFVIHSPTLTSRKWWPGGLGKTATHAIVHARLFIDGKDHGVQAFLVQIRSLETHLPLRGIEVGDIGPKVGFNAVDNGYCSFDHVRIPRDQMMMRYAKVLPDGTFVKPKSDKLVYLTMVQVRAYLLVRMSQALGVGATITTRFSAARVQGRKPDGKGEFQVLDYQNQQHGLFPIIATAYAANFGGRMMVRLHDTALEIIKSGKGSFALKLAELHAVSSGMKAWIAENVSNSIETCRRMCGGHGFSNASNMGHLHNEIVGACTFEGTLDVLVQQHARYLVKVLVSLPYKGDDEADTTSPTGFLIRAKELMDPTLRCKAERPRDFLNVHILREAFETRAARTVIRLAKQLHATNNDGNACMVLMTRASIAHAELMLLTAFIEGLPSIPAGKTRDALATLCSLFGLHLIVRSLGDFREDNYLSSGQADDVRQQLLDLLPVVRKNAVLLTDAWDYSDFEINSAIGRYDGDIYRALVKRTEDEPLNGTQVPESYEAFLKPLIHSSFCKDATTSIIIFVLGSHSALSAMELKDLAPLLLKKERAGGDIDPTVLTNVLRDGADENARRKAMIALAENHPVLSDRDMVYRNHTERYNMGLKKVYHFIQVLRREKITDRTLQQYLYGALGEPLPIDVHRAMFIPTLENQADDEQQRKWLPLARNFKIFGAYAQTELGHGSNVQGIETTATYDKQTQEFVIHSPTLTSRKWWPGGLGKTATHAIVHARLFIDGKDHGVQAFLVQIRSLETHLPLRGIEVGDIGPKVGFNAVDNGYCSFDHVRIPRDQMMMRYAKVLPDGTFVKPKSDKLVYLTMVRVRAYLIVKFGHVMGMTTTITTRFSAARVQGRKPNAKGEFQVLDYQNQQFALFPFIALSYAAFFAGKSMIKLHDSALEVITSGGASFGLKLAELHAVSSGLKAWLAENVNNGIESCRRLCGGHGFSHSSNLAHIFNEAVGAVTYEGTFDVLVQQHARYLLILLKSFVQGLNAVHSGKNRDAVSNLCVLFALWMMTKNLGDFREDNYLSSHQSEQARQQLLALLPIVRKNAVLLTDAWDFTDFEINSTIGRYDGDIYNAMVRRAEDEPLNKSQVPESYEEFLKPLIESAL
ncbi:hypothetical protein P43SY_007526 [Pythium insidiosum]|uniref:acyl-CoA oxidase n=1 Tax=Pythium insidiosum TaxID=114742 RepID=A0AAD5LS85_PYTIN|nr:hypothetical protein P43SY_007526 [Pythium insidiosum]